MSSINSSGPRYEKRGAVAKSVMQFEETNLPGIVRITPKRVRDARGEFVKPYHRKAFEDAGIVFEPREEFFSVSHKGVLRGMHFQAPPMDHAKLVYCIEGEVLDVVVDIRRKSPTYGKTAAFLLSRENRDCLYIPRGFAHGFLVQSESATMVYQTDFEHSPEHDRGVLWCSLDFAWPIREPALSERDGSFPSLQQFQTPFEVCGL